MLFCFSNYPEICYLKFAQAFDTHRNKSGVLSLFVCAGLPCSYWLQCWAETSVGSAMPHSCYVGGFHVQLLQACRYMKTLGTYWHSLHSVCIYTYTLLYTEWIHNEEQIVNSQSCQSQSNRSTRNLWHSVIRPRSFQAQFEPLRSGGDHPDAGAPYRKSSTAIPTSFRHLLTGC